MDGRPMIINVAWKPIAITALLAFLGFAALNRFSVVPAAADKPYAYILDRWTGSVTLFVGAIEVPTKKKSPTQPD